MASIRVRLVISFILSLLVVLGLSVTAAMSQPQVVAVPYAGKTDVPHPAYNGHPTTFKAIARGGTPACVVRWDTNANGSFEDEVDLWPRQCMAGGSGGMTCYDLAHTFLLPPQESSRLFDVGVRVRCPGLPDAFASYRVFVDAQVPPQLDPLDNRTSQPQAATPAQLAVIRRVAIDDALWYLHLRMTSRLGSGAAISGSVAGSPEIPMAGAMAYLLAVQGHLPAYPPGTYVGARPPGFDEANDRRWNEDPYAEDAVRLLNHVVSGLQPVPIPVEDEDDDGLPAIPGTNDGVGLSALPGEEEVFAQGHVLAALATSGLAGTVAQVGVPLQVAGRPMEFLAQQMVDWTVFAQIDVPTKDLGGWGPTANVPIRPAPGASASTSAWATIGLDAAKVAMGPSGVLVNRRCLDRLANVVMHDQDPLAWLARSDGEACPGEGSFGITGAALVSCGLLGCRNFDPLDPTILALDYLGNPITRGAARETLERYMAGLAARWVSFQVDCTAFTSGLFANDGGTNPEPFLRTDGLGNTYAMYSIQKGMRTLQPEAQLLVGTHDPLRELTIYAARNQASDGHWLDNPWGGYLPSPAYYHEPLTTAYLALALSAGLGAGNPCVGGDLDGDGRCVSGELEDCDDADPTVWSAPSEVRVLAVSRAPVTGEAKLLWNPPDDPGGTVLFYDVLRSNTPADFAGPTVVCLETDDASDTLAADPEDPPPGGLFNYLVRAENVCSEGSLGRRSDGTPRIGRSCAYEAPVASFTIDPNPAGCSQPVVFDASASHHPAGPHRSIVTYIWDFGDGVVQSGPDPIVVHPYAHSGDYPVVLIVGDDNIPPRTGSAAGLVHVDVGDHPPIAHSGGPYAMDVGGDLVLDAGGSVEPDQPCGDRIVAYEWDLDGDRVFDECDVGPVAVIPWADLLALVPSLRYPADPATGLPTNEIELRVTDSTGLSSTAMTTVTVYDNRPYARLAVNPNPASCGQVVSFDGSGSTHGHPSRTIVSYEWDFGDWSPASSGPVVTHAYSLDGDYLVQLRVTDDNSPPRTDVASTTLHVSVGDHPPIAQSGGPYAMDVGGDFVLDAGASVEPDQPCGDRIVAYEWDLDGDRVYDDEVGGPLALISWGELLSRVPSLLYPADPATGLPTNEIELRVTDSTGLSSTATTTLTVYDNRPFPRLTVNPDPAMCGQVVSFDASASTHGRPDRSIVLYEWDFGDGPPVIGAPVVPHAYSHGGDYPVQLRVTDDNVPPRTDVASTMLHVGVGDHPPIAQSGGPYAMDVGGDLVLDAGGSVEPDQPCGDRIVAYEWDLDGDRVYDDAVGGPLTLISWGELLSRVPSLRYPADPVTGLPTNEIALRVTDATGLSSTATTTLTIYDNRPFPRFTFNPDPAGCGQVVTFDGSSSTHGHPSRTIVSYEWDFGDATPPAGGPFAFHAYPQLGDYLVRLTVTDDNVPPKSATDSRILHVNLGNRPPVAHPGGPYVMGVGGMLTLDGALSIDPDVPCDSVARYEWDLDGDGVYGFSGPEPVLLVPWPLLLEREPALLYPADPASGFPKNTVRLRVTDRAGASSMAMTTLTIY